jgi:hypothetical protein
LSGRSRRERRSDGYRRPQARRAGYRRRLRGAGNDGPVSTATAVSFLNSRHDGRVTISERIEAGGQPTLHSSPNRNQTSADRHTSTSDRAAHQPVALSGLLGLPAPVGPTIVQVMKSPPHTSCNLNGARPVATGVDLAGQDPWVPSVAAAFQPEPHHCPAPFLPVVLRLLRPRLARVARRLRCSGVRSQVKGTDHLSGRPSDRPPALLTAVPATVPPHCCDGVPVTTVPGSTLGCSVC